METKRISHIPLAMISVGTANVLNLLLKKEKEKNPIFYNDRTENV